MIFSVAGFVALTTGGWLGGAVVFVHGVRVLARESAPGVPSGSERLRNQNPMSVEREVRR